MIWRWWCRENFSLWLLAVASQWVFCLCVSLFCLFRFDVTTARKVIQLSQLLTRHNIQKFPCHIGPSTNSPATLALPTWCSFLLLMLPRSTIIAALATAAALGLLLLQQRPPPQPPRMAPFGAFEFTVHGRVQGVFFRKFTVAKAKALHLVGWCANSQRGTVVGECQGKPEALAEMKVGLGSWGWVRKHTAHSTWRLVWLTHPHCLHWVLLSLCRSGCARKAAHTHT